MTLRGEQGGGRHKNECRHEGGHENKYWEENEQLRNPTRPTPQLGTPQIWREKQNTLNSLFKVYNSYLMKVNLQILLPKQSFRERRSEKLIYSEISNKYVHFSILQNSVLSFIVPSFRMRPFGGRINYLEVLLQIHNFNLMLHKRYRGEINQTSKQ